MLRLFNSLGKKLEDFHPVNERVVNIFTCAAVGLGAFFYLAGTIGLLRFPDTLTRLHALTKADNLGLGLVVLGLLPHAGSAAGVLKLIAIWILVMLSSSDAGQLIARAARSALRRGTPPAG